MRQMATVKEVTEVRPIEGKDRIDQYMIGGWSVIDQKGKYKAGDVVVYLEPDSWVPKEIAPFLCRSEKPKEYCGVVGEKLRTIKMAGVYSQGLILPMSVLPEAEYSIGQDVSEILGIVKWEPPQTFYQGQQKGNFPFFIPKTDQERCIYGDAILETDIGKLTISEIVKNKISCNVKSFNHLNNSIEFKNIIGWSKTTNNKKWVKIKTESGKELKCTIDHLVWNEKLKQYTFADKFSVGDYLLVN